MRNENKVRVTRFLLKRTKSLLSTCFLSSVVTYSQAVWPRSLPILGLLYTAFLGGAQPGSRADESSISGFDDEGYMELAFKINFESA